MSTPITSSVQIKNNLLAALINKDYQHLLPHLERVQLALGEVVYQADSEIRYVYFPETAMVSLLAATEGGTTTEVGLIGREGMVGLAIFLAGTKAFDQAVVQAAGSAMRMKASVLREELRLGSPLQLLLLEYTRAFISLISQSVVCSQYHTTEQRLVRCLLMMIDYVETNQLQLTHEFISNMLGTRRASISEAVSALREAGLISTARRHITILDRQGLESVACECYRIIREEFDCLHDSQIPTRQSA